MASDVRNPQSRPLEADRLMEEALMTPLKDGSVGGSQIAVAWRADQGRDDEFGGGLSIDGARSTLISPIVGRVDGGSEIRGLKTSVSAMAD